MKNYDVIAFDLDGTLTDPENGLVEGFIYAFKKMGVKDYGTRDSLRRFIGPSLYVVWQDEFGFNETTVVEAIEKFREYYNIYGWWDNKVYDGIPEMLAQLKADGVKLAVMSNKNHSHILKMVNALFPDTFDSIWGTIPEVPAKPNPARAFMIADEFGEPIENVAFVGDSDVDMITACNAKAIPVGVSWGYRPAECLRENGAAYTPENADVLYEILKNL